MNGLGCGKWKLAVEALEGEVADLAGGAPGGEA
jgi:hypothetical protein